VSGDVLCVTSTKELFGNSVIVWAGRQKKEGREKLVSVTRAEE
jgi:hypothetical protein